MKSRENLEESRALGIRTGKRRNQMISSNENIGDRLVRRHFNGIIFSAVFSAMAFMVLVALLAMLFFHFENPSIGPPSKTLASPQSTLRGASVNHA
jgi:hypothetical protein